MYNSEGLKILYTYVGLYACMHVDYVFCMIQCQSCLKEIHMLALNSFDQMLLLYDILT